MLTRSVILIFICLTRISAFGQLTAEEIQLIAPSLSFADDSAHSLNLDLQLLQFTQDELPFWMHNNTRGILAEDSKIAAQLSGRAVTFLTRNSQIFFGGGLVYHDGTDSEIKVAELYLHYNNPYFYFTAGTKNRPVAYNGLSASGENILWSLNAASLPGVQLGIEKLVFPIGTSKLGIEGAWEEYFFGTSNHVQDARLHHKFFRLIFQRENWEIKAGLRHFAQWGGNSPKTGQQPEDFRNYLKVFSGKEGFTSTPEGQKIIANHLGSYELFLTRSFFNFDLQFFYNSIFDDLSGRRMKNFPDGRYGVFLEFREKDRLLSSFIYEFYYTQHQSYTAQGFHKHDNYFNNGTYLSGWTYEDRVLGSPFFTIDPEGNGIVNNKFIAHHIGFSGVIGNYFRKYPYRLLLSYAHNDGRYNQRYRPQQDVISGLAETRVLSGIINLGLQFGFDFSSTTAPVYGGGLKLSYEM